MSSESNMAGSGGEKTFRCADAGHTDCRWETSGRTDSEIMDKVREHAGEKHGIRDWTDDLKNKVQSAIHERRAA